MRVQHFKAIGLGLALMGIVTLLSIRSKKASLSLEEGQHVRPRAGKGSLPSPPMPVEDPTDLPGESEKTAMYEDQQNGDVQILPSPLPTPVTDHVNLLGDSENKAMYEEQQIGDIQILPSPLPTPVTDHVNLLGDSENKAMYEEQQNGDIQMNGEKMKHGKASKQVDNMSVAAAEGQQSDLDAAEATLKTTKANSGERRATFGFLPWRGRPKPPEKLADESATWLKDTKYPSWYTDSAKRSRTYGLEEQFVGSGRLYDEPCKNAAKVKAQYKMDKVATFGYVKPGKFIPGSKNPCWYDDPSKKRLLRCLPYFYIAGVAKCGTTDLSKRMRFHPDIMEGELKEYHWWDRLRYGAPMELKFKDGEINDSPLPLSEYSRIIMGKEVENLKEDLRTTGRSVRICGDGSPSYLWDASQWHIFQGNEGCTEPKIVSGSFIKHADPNAKIFLIFRHPTPRLYSRFLSRIDRYPPFKGATPKMFHDYVVKAVGHYKKCFREHSIRECAYNQTLYDEAVIRVIEGLYSVFLEDWLRIFKREQIYFIRNEDYSEDIEGHILDVFDFLEMAVLKKVQMRPILTHVSTNIGQYYDTVGPMLNETIEVLNEFYKPFVLRLYELIGDEKFLWKDIIVK